VAIPIVQNHFKEKQQKEEVKKEKEASKQRFIISLVIG